MPAPRLTRGATLFCDATAGEMEFALKGMYSAGFGGTSPWMCESWVTNLEALTFNLEGSLTVAQCLCSPLTLWGVGGRVGGLSGSARSLLSDS